MKKKTLIETQALKRVPNFVWSFAGISMVFTFLLLANGIHVGTVINKWIDIKLENSKTESKINDLELIEQRKMIELLQKDMRAVKEMAHEATN